LFIFKGNKKVSLILIPILSFYQTLEKNNVINTLHVKISVLQTTAPLWSCCWDMTGTAQDCHLVSLGMTSGEIARFDIRKVTADPVATLNKRGSTMDQSPVSSLVSLPSGYCPSLPRGGLIASQLTTCRIYVGEEDLEGTVLPFQAPFLSVK
jgi:hypothetical protein